MKVEPDGGQSVTLIIRLLFTCLKPQIHNQGG